MSHTRTKCARLWFLGKGISWLDLDELVVDKERQSQMRRKELSMFGVYTSDVSALGCREVGFIGKHGQNPKLV
jgi:hypothetical protein